MAEASTSDRLFSSRGELLRVLAVTVLLPTAIVVADEVVYGLVVQSGWSGRSLFFFNLLVLVQIGFLSAAVGRLVKAPLFSWAIFIWCLLLIDLLLFSLTAQTPAPRTIVQLTYALYSGQFGLLCFWVVFGGMRWPWRLPVGGLLAVFLAGLLTGYAASAWLLVLGFQLLGVIAGLAGLRTCGFRLGHVADDAADTPSGETSRQLQFSLRHLLVWSTVAAVVFVLANAIQLSNMRYLDVADVAQAVSIAACLSVVAVTAIWAALSREKVFLRLAVLIALIGAAGALLWWVNVSRTQALFARGVLPNASYLRWEMHRLGYWWFAWSLLSGLFLAELLLFFRVRGYRLARRVRGS